MTPNSSFAPTRTPVRLALVITIVAMAAALSSGLLRGSMPAVPTGSWVATGSPSDGGTGAAAVLIPGSGVLITGGADASGSMASVEWFGTGGAFAGAAAMGEARADHTAVLLKDGRVLVAGGRNAEGVTGSVELFADGSWSAAGGLTDARWGHTATVLKDGRVLVAGGENPAGALMSVELFDPATGAFSVLGSMAAPRKGHAAALLADGRVIIAGGGTDEAVLATTEIFDPGTLQLSSGPSLNTGRFGLTATTLLDGRVVFIGGHNGTWNLASAEIYSDVANAITYTATTTPMVPRRGHHAFLLPNNNAVLIVGGIAEEMVNGVGVEQVTSAAELYLPWIVGGEVWQTGGMTVARSQASGAPLSGESYGAAPAGDGLVMVTGGAGQSSAEAYRFATIRTDKDDYSPGMTVYVSGSGWQPGETVTFALRELPAEHASRTFTLDADELGQISNAILFDVEDHHLDVAFLLTARGAASQAQVSFRDSNPQNITLSPNSATVPQGGTASYGEVTVVKGGNNNLCTITLGVSAAGGTGLPAGATATFATNPLAMTTANVVTSLDVTTTAATPTGTFTFRVTGTNSGAGCQGPGAAASDFVTLVVQDGAVSTTVSATNAAATHGDASVSLNSTVTPASGPAVATGSVTFTVKNGVTTVGTVGPAAVTSGSANASFMLGGVDAGTYTIEAAYDAGAGFDSSDNLSQSPAPTLTVSQKPVTGSFTADHKTYDGTTSATVLTRSLSGVVGTDDVTLTGGTAAFVDGNVGSAKTVTLSGASLAGTSAGNYVLSLVDTATASITPVSLTPSVTVGNKTYDGTTAAVISGRAFANSGAIIFEDDVTLVGGTAAFGDKNAGAAKTVNVTGLSLSGDDASNYVLASTTATASADITPKGITGSFTADSKVYDGTTAATIASQALDGAISGDEVILDGGTAAFDNQHVGTGKTVTLTGATLGGADGGNYSLTSTSTAAADITPIVLTGSITSDDKTYDGTPAAEVTATLGPGVLSGETVTVTASNGQFDSKDVGQNKPVTADLALGGGSETNYVLSAATATTHADISPKGLSASFTAENKVYDGTTAATVAGSSLPGVVDGDDLILNVTNAQFDTKDVGNGKTVTADLALAGAQAANYSVSAAATAAANITPQVIAVTADAQSKVYGSDDPSLTYQLSGGTLVDGDSLAGALTREPGENVGTYAIQQGALTAGGNYDLTFAGANLAITPATLTMTADQQTKVYGDLDPALTYVVSGLQLSDTEAEVVSGGLVRAAGENVGTYAIGQGSVASSTNYALSFTGADLTVTAKAIAMVADTQTKTYGDTDPALTYTFSPALVSGDSFSGSLTRASGEAVGSYAIEQGSVALDGNYDLSYAGADLTISKRAVAIAADAKSKTYGEGDPALTHQITSGSLAFSDAFTGVLTRASGEAVGSYAIEQGSVALDGNYDLSYAGADLTIATRPITAAADPKVKILGAPDPALTYQVTSGNLVNGDTFTGALTRASGEAIGTYAIQQGTLTLSSNYQLTYGGANVKIVYRWDGFLQPITNTAHDQHQTAVYSSFKTGQTIPVKFELKDASGSAVSQTGNPVFTRTGNLGGCASPTLPEDLIGAVAADSDGLYKVSGSGYHYGWNTKGLTRGLYLIFANLADGTQRSAAICLTK